MDRAPHAGARKGWDDVSKDVARPFLLPRQMRSGWAGPPIGQDGIVTTRGRRDPALQAQVTETRPLAGVRAGSALLAVGRELLVVGDDAQAVTWLDPAGETERAMVLAGDGEALPKPLKPDFECAARGPDGAVWIFGSGSLPTRRQVVCLGGPDHTVVSAFPAEGLYDALEARLRCAPNIEGALFLPDRLRLFHRAATTDPDVWFDLDLDAEIDPVMATGELTVGELDGVPLHLTDVAASSAGWVGFLATAEDTPDAVADGPVAGSVIGVLGSLGNDAAPPRWAELAGVAKAEGLVLTGSGAWVVTDRDDPSAPAELCRLELAGPW